MVPAEKRFESRKKMLKARVSRQLDKAQKKQTKAQKLEARKALRLAKVERRRKRREALVAARSAKAAQLGVSMEELADPKGQRKRQRRLARVYANEEAHARKIAKVAVRLIADTLGSKKQPLTDEAIAAMEEDAVAAYLQQEGIEKPAALTAPAAAAPAAATSVSQQPASGAGAAAQAASPVDMEMDTVEDTRAGSPAGPTDAVASLKTGKKGKKKKKDAGLQ